MSILSDFEIEQLCQGETPMISPFFRNSIKVNESGNKALSFGSSSYGYDVRLDHNVRIFSNLDARLVDPKRLDERVLIHRQAEKDENGDTYVIIPPNSYLLGVTMEEFLLPRDITVVVVGKSTYARAGLQVCCTPAEAGWGGRLVIEIANSHPVASKVYTGEGIAQFLFFRGNQPCRVSYADRKGRYHLQDGITLPHVNYRD